MGYYNIVDAAKCMSHMHDLVGSVHRSTQLPLMLLRVASPDVEIAILEAQRCRSMRAVHPRCDDASITMVHATYLSEKPPAFHSILPEVVKVYLQEDESTFSPGMKSCIVVEDGVKRCRLCNTEITAAHWNSNKHLKKLKNGHLADVVKHEWCSDRRVWQDVSDDNDDDWGPWKRTESSRAVPDPAANAEASQAKRPRTDAP